MAIVIKKKIAVGTEPVPSNTRPLQLMSVQDAADYAKVSTQTVRRAIKAGDLKIYRMCWQIRIDESDLVNYLSS